MQQSWSEYNLITQLLIQLDTAVVGMPSGNSMSMWNPFRWIRIERCYTSLNCRDLDWCNIANFSDIEMQSPQKTCRTRLWDLSEELCENFCLPLLLEGEAGGYESSVNPVMLITTMTTAPLQKEREGESSFAILEGTSSGESSLQLVLC